MSRTKYIYIKAFFILLLFTTDSIVVSAQTKKISHKVDGLNINEDCVFDAEKIEQYQIMLTKIVTYSGQDEFIDQLQDLIESKDSMFYIIDTKIVSVKRGLFRKRSYPQRTKILFSPESVLKENIGMLRYLQRHYQCQQAKVPIETKQE